MVERLREGMVTARPLLERRRVLLNTGTTLTAKHLHLLRAWGVIQVWIESEEDEGGGSVGEPAGVDNELMRQEIEYRFSKCDVAASDYLRALRAIVLSRAVSRGGDDAGA
jgi:hypothetical protein